MKRTSKPIKAWAGFVGGKIDIAYVRLFAHADEWAAPIIFLSRGEARNKYYDVRRVEIREVPRKKKARKT